MGGGVGGVEKRDKAEIAGKSERRRWKEGEGTKGWVGRETERESEGSGGRTER